jgi:hypothetical protein
LLNFQSGQIGKKNNTRHKGSLGYVFAHYFPNRPQQSFFVYWRIVVIIPAQAGGSNAVLQDLTPAVARQYSTHG